MISLLKALARSLLKNELQELESEAQSKNATIRSLDAALESTLQSRHELVVSMRHVMESVSDGLLPFESAAHSDLRSIAQSLPYLLSGSQTWRGPSVPHWTSAECARAADVAAKYGFALPGDPVPAVMSCLAIAQHIACSSHNVQLHAWRSRHPLPEAVAS